ncbi:YiiX/YebB-like N1pC/P60 family cysteine hydrolase [Lutibacter sp.]|uniref:YiiX/YebB-like N1pC/P60 family cysteine hydrolase n=1 Tax=Lutibacter sp. TaxID=1925666 RepID=UPI001A2FA1BB|nr:YiiX/YebB-like N1pC/P60 family cysteine hydrolase [Lutibacter sp.]MBI9041717.1 hypothetical protein [Lutibacter sp.]
MVKKSLLIVSLLLSLFFCVKFLSFKNKTNYCPTETLNKIQNGDLVLRCGRSIESFTVYTADNNSEFSHIGIISIENNMSYVIHAVPCNDNLIKKEKLTDFISPKFASTYAIYRTNFNTSILKKVVNQAKLFRIKKYTFDTNYDLKTNTKLYCTELVLKAFKNSGIELNIKPSEFNYIVGKQEIILPSEFTKSPYFYKII